MNYLLITFVVMYFSFNLVLSKPGSMYTTEFDNINVEEILHSKRMLKNYMDCVMDRGSCTRDGAELKKNLREAMETKCAKCSEKQKENAKKVLKYLHEHEKGYCKELREKIDPDDTYYKQLQEEAKKEGIILED